MHIPVRQTMSTNGLALLPSCVLHSLLTSHGLNGADLVALAHADVVPVATQEAARALVSAARWDAPNEHAISGKWPEALAFLDALARFVSPVQGIVYAAGKNSDGQCSIPASSTFVSAFERVPSIDNVIQVAAGARHSLLVTANGVAYAAGDNFNGRLGVGLSVHNPPFTPVHPLFTPIDITPHHAVQCAAGGKHSVLLTAEGIVLTAGGNARGQLGFPDWKDRVSFSAPPLPRCAGRIIQVAAGASHTVLLSESGRVFVCGDNVCGQLGLASAKTTVGRFTEVDGLPERAWFVAAGDVHTLIIGISRMNVYGVGLNCTGQLGTNDRLDRHSFVQVKATWRSPSEQAARCDTSEELVSAVSAGGSHSLLVTSGGKLLASGEFYYRNGEVRHRECFGVIATGVVSASAGWNHGVAIPGKGATSVLVAGANSHGELGMGDNVPRGRFTVADIPSEPLLAAAGGSHTLLVARTHTP